MRFLLATAGTIAITLFMWLFMGIKVPIVISVLIGLLSYNIADYLISKGDEKKAVLEMAKKLWRNLSEVAILILIASASYDYSGSPTQPIVQQTYSTINSFGLLTALCVAFIAPFVASAVSSQDDKPNIPWMITSSLKRTVRAMTAYYLALFVVGKFGDSIYVTLQSKPNLVISSAITAYVCYIIFKIGNHQSSQIQTQRYSSIGYARYAKPLSLEDRRHTAAHEAGHALVYAALGRLPLDAQIVIHDQPNSGIAGYVRATVLEDRLLDSVMIEWNMLVLLAGKIGETVIHGVSTLGSERDHQHWLSYARTYLSNHYHGVFFNEPKDSFEQASNIAKLDALQVKQTALLNTFFEMNAEVHQQFTDEILKVRTMDRDAIITFLSRVKLPDEFPRPFGHFEAFDSNWA